MSTWPASDGRRLRVVHLPVYTDNAYQPELMRCLRALGVDAIDGGGGGNFLRTALVRWRADICHFHWLHPYLLRSSRWASFVRATRFLVEIAVLKAAGIRVVWTVHNLVNHDRRFPSIERFYSRVFARLADAVLVHSEHGKKVAQAAFGIDLRKPIAVIPQGSYVSSYPSGRSRDECRKLLDLSPDELVFLFLGRIEPYKQVPELIEAFNGLAGDATLLIAGRVSDEGLLQRIRATMNGASSIRFRQGYVDADEVQIYMNAADVFVCPSAHVLNSSSITLAMSFGLPCVAPDIDANRDSLARGGGFLYDPTQACGLAEALRTAAAERNELARMGQRNRHRASRWTWESMAEQTLSRYRRVLHRANEPAREPDAGHRPLPSR